MSPQGIINRADDNRYTKFYNSGVGIMNYCEILEKGDEVTPLCPECRAQLKIDSHERHFCIECEYKDNPDYHEWKRRERCLDRIERTSGKHIKLRTRYEIAMGS